MLEPKTFGNLIPIPQISHSLFLDWSDIQSDSEYETQLGTFLSQRMFIYLFL